MGWGGMDWSGVERCGEDRSRIEWKLNIEEPS